MTEKTSSSKPSPRRSYRATEKKNSPSRIAESVAVHSTAKSSSVVKPRRVERRIGGLAASDEVWQFAVANDLIPDLETAVRLVYECFPTVREVQLMYEVDWDVENRSWIAIEIKVVGTQEIILEQYDCFTSRMVKLVPPDKGEKILLGF